MLKSRSGRSKGCASVDLLAKRRAIIFLMVVVVGGLIALPTLAQSPQVATPSAVEAQVKKFGVGKDVKVRLTDGAKLRGHIASIGANSFTLRLRKNKTERTLAYNQIALIKDPGPIFWILIGAAIVVIIIVAVH
jgi:hypothetical protein